MNKLLVKVVSAWDKQISYVFCSSIVLFILQLTYVEICSKNLYSQKKPKINTSKPIISITSSSKDPAQFELEKPSRHRKTIDGAK